MGAPSSPVPGRAGREQSVLPGASATGAAVRRGHGSSTSPLPRWGKTEIMSPPRKRARKCAGERGGRGKPVLLRAPSSRRGGEGLRSCPGPALFSGAGTCETSLGTSGVPCERTPIHPPDIPSEPRATMTAVPRPSQWGGTGIGIPRVWHPDPTRPDPHRGPGPAAHRHCYRRRFLPSRIPRENRPTWSTKARETSGIMDTSGAVPAPRREYG